MLQGITRVSVPCGVVKFSFSRLSLRSSNRIGMRGLTVDALNPAILNVQYAVRGELAIKAEEYRERLKAGGPHDLPFTKVISSNIGNPQQAGLDQPPITFNRQVRPPVFFFVFQFSGFGAFDALALLFFLSLRPLFGINLTLPFGGVWGIFGSLVGDVVQVAALMEWPALAERARDVFPEDVIARAKELQSEIGSIGAYSHSQGVPFIRKNVARFIEGLFVVTISVILPLPLFPSHPTPLYPYLGEGGREAPWFTLPKPSLELISRHPHSQNEMDTRRTQTTYS